MSLKSRSRQLCKNHCGQVLEYWALLVGVDREVPSQFLLIPKKKAHCTSVAVI